MSNIKFDVKNLNLHYGKFHALKDVNMEIPEKQITAFIGPSGCGKTTTLRILGGFETPDTGKVLFNGQDITQLPPNKRQLNTVFQKYALFSHLNVFENVAFGLLENQKMPRRQAREKAVEVLRQVGLGPDVADLSPSELSGGMQKRVGLARAVATRPEIIFFDEPTTGLDPIMADVINDLIIDSVKKLGASALTITHDMASARKIADRIAMLYQGKIIWQGTVAEMDKTDNPYVCQFVNGCSKGPIKVEV